MRIAGTFVFDGPRERVFDLLLDPAVLSRAIPGDQELVILQDDLYEGDLVVRLGPVPAARFSLTVRIEDKVAPERYAMAVEANGRLGGGKGIAFIKLESMGSGTLMRYDARLRVRGPLARLGAVFLDGLGETLARRGLATLNDDLSGARSDA
jgi:carbon monoxide dehydrogenase subunit G